MKRDRGQKIIERFQKKMWWERSKKFRLSECHHKLLEKHDARERIAVRFVCREFGKYQNGNVRKLAHLSTFTSSLFSFTHGQIIVYFYDATKEGIHKMPTKMPITYTTVPLYRVKYDPATSDVLIYLSDSYTLTKKYLIYCSWHVCPFDHNFLLNIIIRYSRMTPFRKTHHYPRQNCNKNWRFWQNRNAGSMAVPK